MHNRLVILFVIDFLAACVFLVLYSCWLYHPVAEDIIFQQAKDEIAASTTNATTMPATQNTLDSLNRFEELNRALIRSTEPGSPARLATAADTVVGIAESEQLEAMTARRLFAAAFGILVMNLLVLAPALRGNNSNDQRTG